MNGRKGKEVVVIEKLRAVWSDHGKAFMVTVAQRMGRKR
jgi:hypothetical protein